MKKIILSVVMVLIFTSCSQVSKYFDRKVEDIKSSEINLSDNQNSNNEKSKSDRLKDSLESIDQAPTGIINKVNKDDENSLDISINNSLYLINWINNLDEDLNLPDHRRNKCGWYSSEYEEFAERPIYEFYNDDIVVDIGPLQLVDYQEGFGENVLAITLDVMIENISDENFFINGSNSSIYLDSDIEYDCFYDDSIKTANQNPGDINAYQMVFPIDDFREYDHGFVIDFYYSTDEFDEGSEDLRHLYMLMNITEDDKLEVGSLDDYNEAIEILSGKSSKKDKRFKFL